MELKEIRIENEITQSEASKMLGVSLRSYKSYENEEEKKESLKYQYLCEKLLALFAFDEEHGLLTLKKIKDVTTRVFERYDIDFCYLFGSYAKGKAKGNSDVDLLINCSLKGLKYVGLIEELREALGKKIDLIKMEELDNNQTLLREVLKDGIKIYG